MRILVCGGRDFTNELKLNNELAKIISGAGNCEYLYNGHIEIKNTTIISGKAKGADTLAEDFAKFYHIPFEGYSADWDKYGKKAGPIRNQQMLDKGKPDLVVAFHGKPRDDNRKTGTMDMVERARKANIKIVEIKYKGE